MEKGKDSLRRRFAFWIERRGWQILAILIAIPGLVYVVLLIYSFAGFFLSVAFGAPGSWGILIGLVCVAGPLILLWALIPRGRLPKDLKRTQLDINRRVHFPAGVYGKGLIHFENGGPLPSRRNRD